LIRVIWRASGQSSFHILSVNGSLSVPEDGGAVPVNVLLSSVQRLVALSPAQPELASPKARLARRSLTGLRKQTGFSYFLEEQARIHEVLTDTIVYRYTNTGYHTVQ